MRVLLLSAYHAHSHQYWCDGLVAQFPEHDWTVLTLPARYFSWRIRGNGLTWSVLEAERLREPYDLVLATSMVDLTTLRGLVPSLAMARNILYFHENQFAYPQSASQHKSVEPQMVSIYSALAADQIYFNSDYNRTTFLTGVEQLLQRLPDCVPAGITQQLKLKSKILPVPIHGLGSVYEGAKSKVLHVVWNHRWEYDKGADLLFEAIQLLPEDIAIRFSILGQSFRQVPEVFTHLQALLSQRGWLCHWGFIKRFEAYQEVLQSAHVVLSTSLHDFQGLAVLQAVSAGCIPLVPDRLAYKEFFASQYCYRGGEYSEAQALAFKLKSMVSQFHLSKLPAAPDITGWYWPTMRPAYKFELGL